MTDATDGPEEPSDAADTPEEPSPPPEPPSSDDSADENPSGVVGWLTWFWTADSGSVVYARDVATSVGIVLLVGAFLFAISGLWPPMVAVESGSMEPNMERGDLVFIIDNDRFTPDEAVTNGGETTGIVPADVAAETDREKFGQHGDVIVFNPDGDEWRTPVIHRAMLWVDDGENWYDRADPDAIGGAEDCEALENCPAPHGGFVTKGDNEVTNSNYDQVTTLSEPVRPEWVVGTAEVKVPYLGHVRLAFSTVTTPEAIAAGDVSASTAHNGTAV